MPIVGWVEPHSGEAQRVRCADELGSNEPGGPARLVG